MNSFGIFEEVYAADKKHNGLYLASGNQSTIGWLGAIAILFLFGSSPIAGAMMDAFGPKVCVLLQYLQSNRALWLVVPDSNANTCFSQSSYSPASVPLE